MDLNDIFKISQFEIDGAKYYVTFGLFYDDAKNPFLKLMAMDDEKKSIIASIKLPTEDIKDLSSDQLEQVKKDFLTKTLEKIKEDVQESTIEDDDSLLNEIE